MEPTNVTHFESPASFREWLEQRHGSETELWVGYWKKATGRPTITWEESVDVALCFGWIDGIRKRVDDEAFTVRFTPRRNGSIWSLRNVERYTALEAAGLIAPAGVTAFDERKHGRTGVYSFEQDTPVVLSDEYEARLRAIDEAWADWEKRPPGYRRQVAHWVMSAKREETRERRLAALIEDSSLGRKVKPLR